MSLLVSDFITQAQQELTNIGQRISTADYYLYLNRANKYFMTEYKMPTTEREYNILLFSDVHEYAVPSDFQAFSEPKRPYALHSPRFRHTTAKDFNHWHHDRITALKYSRETPYWIINDDTEGALRIHDFESITDNGTWAVSGDGASLALDKQIYTENSASLRFTITGSGGTTTLENSTFNAIDLTDYIVQAYAFVDLYIPETNTTAISSVQLRLGSDASNYYQISATTRHRGDTILGGWGLIGFDLSNKTTVGTPTDTAIDYAQIVITHGTSGIDGVYRVDNLFISNPTFYQIPYYSLYNVKTAAGTYQEKVTASDDTLLCPVGTEEAFIYKALEIAALTREKDSGLASYFGRELAPKENVLRTQFPKQNSRPSVVWYKNAGNF